MISEEWSLAARRHDVHEENWESPLERNTAIYSHTAFNFGISSVKCSSTLQRWSS
jgi:hypothetical protein